MIAERAKNIWQNKMSYLLDLSKHKPLVKYIRNYIRGPSAVFSISSPMTKDIDDVISILHFRPR